MTVRFRTTLNDEWHRLSYLPFPSKCFLALIPVSPMLIHAVRLYQTTPIAKIPAALWPYAAALCFGYLVGAMIGHFMSPVVTPRTIVTIDNHHCCWRQVGPIKMPRRAWPVKMPWRDFNTISTGATHLHFGGRRRSVLIPRRAFRSEAKADAFFNAAYAYWREAKEAAARPAPDMVGVWPPAPRISDAQELDAKP